MTTKTIQKEYTLEDFEEALKETVDNFPQKSMFGYVGLIGSLNTKRDLDLLVLPKKGVRHGEFLRTLAEFLEPLEKNLAKRDVGFVAFTHTYLEEEVKYLSKRDINKDALVHIVSIYDWKELQDEAIDILVNSVEKTQKTYHGSVENIIALQKIDTTYLSNYLFVANCFHSRYPEALVNEKIKERMNYIVKYLGETLDFDNKSNKEIYFEVCDLMDKKE